MELKERWNWEYDRWKCLTKRKDGTSIFEVWDQDIRKLDDKTEDRVQP